jgi:hypothetical protein
MRSALHGPGEFLLRSKKPRIRDLVARCAEMSIDDIRKLPEKPDVIRGLLEIRKRGDQAESASRAEILADMMIAKHHPELARRSDI